jgi:hypothetical protein
MSKRILFAMLLLLLAAVDLRAQQTVVNATVIDPRGFPYQGGGGTFVISCPANNQPYVGTTPIPRSIPVNTLDGSGHFQQTLYDTNFLVDVNNAPLVCQWKVNINDSCQAAFFSTLLTGVTGAGPVNLSSQINAAAVNLSPACTPPATVQSVSVNGLPPLFTASVSNPTVNPVISFAQISENANLVFGNCTNAPANPTFCSLTSAMLPPGTGTVTNVTASPPIISSGGATPNIACPTCVTSVSGTANQITSSGGTTPTLSIPATFIAPGSIQATTSVTAANVTDSALTNGNCVQAAGGGLLSTTSAPCGTVSGVTVIRTASGTTGSNTQGTSFANVDVTMTWSGGGFADTSYIPVCSIKDASIQASGGDGGSGDVPNAPIRSFTATQITVAVTTLAARVITAGTPTVYCIGVHP